MLRTLELIRKRSKGKHTRLKVLFALLRLGPGYHTGKDIRASFRRLFPGDHFDFMYLEPLCYSYKITRMKPELRKSKFLREAKNALFKIQEEYHKYILDYFLRKYEYITKV